MTNTEKYEHSLWPPDEPKSSVHVYHFSSVFGLHQLLIWLFRCETLPSVHHPVTNFNTWCQINFWKRMVDFSCVGTLLKPWRNVGSRVIKCAKKKLAKLENRGAREVDARLFWIKIVFLRLNPHCLSLPLHPFFSAQPPSSSSSSSLALQPDLIDLHSDLFPSRSSSAPLFTCWSAGL